MAVVDKPDWTCGTRRIFFAASNGGISRVLAPRQLIVRCRMSRHVFKEVEKSAGYLELTPFFRYRSRPVDRNINPLVAAFRL